MKSSQECVLCCRDIEIYAVGACDHEVCYECSTRMRVLCETNECPICRSDVPIVVFTHEAHDYSTAKGKYSSINRTYNIRFEDEIIAAAFDGLLENRCKSCSEMKPSFNKLKEHVRREHELHYCDLCTDNLKIFTFERKCYSRKDLARHKRVGDPDETSHRGHPLCEFCDMRFMDKDDLFRHLRREHYFCHFCDADGKHQYYKDYDYLRVHFRKDHYLCEEGDCVNEKFIGAFRSEIDLKAHTAIHHSKNKSKQEVKQTRLLEFEFAAPARYSGSSSPRGGRYPQNRRRNEDDLNSRDRYKTNQQAEVEQLDTQSVQDFPYLSEDVKSAEISLQSFNRNAPQAYRNNKMSPEDFPALCSAPETSSNQSKKMNYSAPTQFPQRNGTKQISSGKHQIRTGELDNVDRTAPQQKGKWMNNKSNLNFEEDFPTLEVRKKTAMPTVVAPVPITVNSVQSSATVNRPPADTVAKPPVVDQFVIIKSKSKKKKPSKMPFQSEFDKEDLNLDLPDEKEKPAPQNDQGYNCPFKKSFVHPRLSSNPPSAKNYDYWEQEKASFGNDDFPPLAPTEPVKKPAPVKRPPPGIKAVEKPNPPPPGFSASFCKPTAGHKSLANLVREIVLPSQNGVDKSFTDEVPSFVKPNDFSQRNDNLIKRIYDLTEETLFNKFKVESGKFRHSTISAAEYHAKCLEILGDDGFIEIFPELVSLLPDIKKQQELLTVHDTFLSHKRRGAFSKRTQVAASPVVSCDRCNQVLVTPDCTSHMLSHS